jgi:hypothetical protein
LVSHLYPFNSTTVVLEPSINTSYSKITVFLVNYELKEGKKSNLLNNVMKS